MKGGDDDQDQVDIILQYLRSKNADTRRRAIVDMRKYVEAQSRSTTPENFTKLMHDRDRGVVSRLFALTKSPELEDKLGGLQVTIWFEHDRIHLSVTFSRVYVQAIDQLIDVSTEENESKIVRFANGLRMFLSQDCEAPEPLVIAAKALGHLARSGGSLESSDFVDFEVKRALEWLQGDRHEQQSQRRHSACLVLKEMAESAKGIFYFNITPFLDHIWVALRDKKPIIRETARDALSACLKLINERQSALCNEWYNKLYEGVDRGYARGSEHTIHGSLLTIGEMLQHTGSFLLPRYNDICKKVLAYKDVRYKIVCRTVSQLLPRLAKFHPDTFVHGYLDVCLAHLRNSARHGSSDGRAVAFLAVGELAVAVRQHIKPQLDAIIALVRDSLSKKKLWIEAMVCVSRLAQSVGPALAKFMPQLLDQMAQAGGLNATFFEAAAIMAIHIPSHRLMIQERLVAEISLVLCGVPYTPPGGMLGPNAALFVPAKSPKVRGGGGGAVRALGSLSSALSSSINLLPGTGSSNKTPKHGHQMSISSMTSSMSWGQPSTTLKRSKSLDGKSMGGMQDDTFDVSDLDGDDFQWGADLAADHRKGEPDKADDALLALCLQTLGSFDFGEMPLLPLVRSAVLHFLDHSDDNVRRHAAITCSRLLLNNGLRYTTFSAPNPNLAHRGALGGQGQQQQQKQPLVLWRKGPTADTVQKILGKLLTVGASDPDPSIRHAVVSSLDQAFDGYLAQPELLRPLFIVLNDEVFTIRQAAVAVIRRLSKLNPAYVLPPLRRMLIQLLTELRYSDSSKGLEESVELLGQILCTSRRLMLCYLPPMLAALTDLLRDSNSTSTNSTVATAVLVTLGELCKTVGPDMRQYLQQLLPLVIETLQDQSSVRKRISALQTLGHLVRQTGCVIQPYLQYTKLLGLLLRMLQQPMGGGSGGMGGSSKPWELRKEVIKVMGIIGAIEPYKYQQALLRQQNGNRKESIGNEQDTKKARADSTASQGSEEKGEKRSAQQQEEELKQQQQQQQQLQEEGYDEMPGSSYTGGSTGNAYHDRFMLKEDAILANVTEPQPKVTEGQQLATRLTPSSSEFFSAVAISTLMHILGETTLAAYHDRAVQAVMFVFKSLGLKCVPFLDEIIPPMLQVASSATCQRGLREFIFQQLATLVSIVKQNMRKYVGDVFVVLKNYWFDNLEQVLPLVEEINRVLKDEFKAYMPELIPLLIKPLEIVMQTQTAGTGAMNMGANNVNIMERGLGLNMDPSMQGHSIARSAPIAIGAPNKPTMGMGMGMNTGMGMGQLKSQMSFSSQAVVKVLRTLVVLGPALDSYLYLLIPTLISLLGRPAEQLHTLKALSKLCRVMALGTYASRVVHPLARVLESSRFEVLQYAIDTLCAIAVQIGPSFTIFAPMISKILKKRGFIVTTLGMRPRSMSRAGSGELMSFGGDHNHSHGRGDAVTRTHTHGGSTHTHEGAHEPMSPARSHSRTGSSVGHARSNSTAAAKAGSHSHDHSHSHGGAQPQSPGHDTKSKFEQSMCGSRIDKQVLKAAQPQVAAAMMEASMALDRYEELLVLLERDNGTCSSSCYNHTFDDNNRHDRDPWDDGGAAGVSGTSDDGGGGGGGGGGGAADASPKKLHVNQQNLRRVLETAQRSTKDDWVDWLRKFSVELLRESPSAALRACSALAQVYQPLARELFNAAFVSCWTELHPQYQDYLVKSIELAFRSPSIPPEILQQLLNLAEFMEHDVEALPIDIRQLGEVAEKCHAYAKALHYKELEFHTSPTTTIESLISINNKLGQPEAAEGILQYAQKHRSQNSLVIDVKETWYEKLENWQDALRLYERRLHENPNDTQAMVGTVRCLHSLGEYEALDQICRTMQRRVNLATGRSVQYLVSPTDIADIGKLEVPVGDVMSNEHADIFASSNAARAAVTAAAGQKGTADVALQLNAEDRQTIANFGCDAAWQLERWDVLEDYVGLCWDSAKGEVPRGAYDHYAAGYAFRVVLAVHKQQLQAARILIDRTRRALDTTLSSSMSESYARGYHVVIELQLLAELEEVVDFMELVKEKEAECKARGLRHMSMGGEGVGQKHPEVLRQRAHLRRLWSDRLNGCKYDVETWRRLLAVRKFVFPMHDDVDTWLSFVSLCRRSNKPTLSIKTLKKLQSFFTIPGAGGACLPSFGLQGLSLDILPLDNEKSARLPNFDAADGARAKGIVQQKQQQQPQQQQQQQQQPQQQKAPGRSSGAAVDGDASSSDNDADMPTLVQLTHQSSVTFAYLKHLWSVDKREDACEQLSQLVHHPYLRLHGTRQQHANMPSKGSQQEYRELTRVRVRCLLKLADWQMKLCNNKLTHANLDTVQQLLKEATDLNPGNYSAWHQWALMNYQVVEQYYSVYARGKAMLAGLGSAEGDGAWSRDGPPSGKPGDYAVEEKLRILKPGAQCGQYCNVVDPNWSGRIKVRMDNGDTKSYLPEELGQDRLGGSAGTSKSSRRVIHSVAAAKAESKFIPFIEPAVSGFFRSINLGRSRWGVAKVQPDILRLLTLWFAHGQRPEVHAALVKGFDLVSIDTWLAVIPQLIARIHSPNLQIRKLLHDLMKRIVIKHPQALIYPLSVALNSPLKARQQEAEEILGTMRAHRLMLVDQSLLVSRELIRIAILWHEMWHEGLEEASRLYFGENDVPGMMRTLMPLHEMMQKGPETHREESFEQHFGRELGDAYTWLCKYSRCATNEERKQALDRAWDMYYQVFRRINKQLPQLTKLELNFVSPALLDANDLELAVPGTWDVSRGEHDICIQSVVPTIQVISSKQRPRKVAMTGSNGEEYVFLLKGHEDLRQDERVMQLFGLVNVLLLDDRATRKRDLGIQRYSVIPLSSNAGLVGWVPLSDTLHQLIRDYRQARRIMLNVEHRLMLQMAPDHEHLTLMQKVEVFEYALANTGGQDLYKVLWLKSQHSEQWLMRRTNYTRSLAVMSMVGYMLGLGDRHPSNLMLDRRSGKILHIDFGDCFEVAMHRDKYPEKIPFRLTRMLTNAMEVSGIEGNFRSSCESVMHVLRSNSDSLMAMLEAFVHDPLINWRLLGAAVPANPSPNGSSSSTSAVPANPSPNGSNSNTSSSQGEHAGTAVVAGVAEEQQTQAQQGQQPASATQQPVAPQQAADAPAVPATAAATKGGASSAFKPVGETQPASVGAVATTALLPTLTLTSLAPSASQGLEKIEEAAAGAANIEKEQIEKPAGITATGVALEAPEAGGAEGAAEAAKEKKGDEESDEDEAVTGRTAKREENAKGEENEANDSEEDDDGQVPMSVAGRTDVHLVRTDSFFPHLFD
jgi:phosphatidylinositol kinase/protein kinase (PI-3  family)